MIEDLEYYRNSEFNLGELVSIAEAILKRIAYFSVDGRVAVIPDERTVRYYQTVGVLKKPSRYDGRSALYGYHHLLQLLAIKLLQAQGLSLAQIQNAMIQLTSEDLEKQLITVMNAGDQGASPSVGRRNLLIGNPLTMSQIDERYASGCEETAEDWAPIYEKPRDFLAHDLIAAEILPGVSILIDPKKVKDAKGALENLRAFLQKILGDIE